MNPTLRAWNKTGQLPGLKFMRTRWVGQATGGPFTYSGKDRGQAHKELHITSAEFDEVGAEIGCALDHFKVTAREKQLLAAIVARKSEVVRPPRWSG